MTTVSTYTASQLAGMSAAQISSLSTATLSSLGAPQVQALGISQLNGISASAFQAVNAAYLSKAQISSLTTALVNLSLNQASELSATQISDFSAAQIGQLSGKVLSGLGASEIAALSTTQVQAISTSAIAQISTSTVKAMSLTQLAALTKPQVQALTSTQIASLSSNSLNAINISNLTSGQLGALTASQVAGFSPANFQKAIAPNLAALSAAGLSGLTQAQVMSLTSAQLTTLAPASLTGAAKSYVNDFNSIMSTAQKDDIGGTMTFSSAEALLTTSSQGGMTAGKLAALQTVAGELNATSGPSITASAIVTQLFDNVVTGTKENAYYTGGGAKSVALGNLTAMSTQTQVGELIGKWFLGNDDPSLTGTQAAGYAVQSGNLFSAAGPQAADVNQGTLGDCYFLAALSDEASQNPNAIKNMITSDGNGVYTVDFKKNGADNYITVDDAMATLPKGAHVTDGSNLAFDDGGASGSMWSEIVEKAYTEFRGDTDVSANSASAPQNSYTRINGGWDEGIAAITGQSVNDYAASSYKSTTAEKSLATALQSAIISKNVVTMSTESANNAALGLIGNHMYAVLSLNASTGMAIIDNPWNANAGTSGGTETVSILALLAQGVTFHAAAGQAFVS
jgi:hypothetical protein